MLKSAALALVSVMLATAGQFLLKAGMDKVGYVGADQVRKPVDLVLTVVRTPQIILGMAVFGLASAFWLVVLSRLPLSTAYPFAGLTYILVTAIAKVGLKEHVPGLRWVGILLIVGGIILVGRSAPPDIG
jgi:drug/metabolite transporter (DMT)-like permease